MFMKTVMFALFAICFAGVASAASTTVPAADSSACKTPVQKAQLRAWLNGKSGAVMPSCHKPISFKGPGLSTAACKGLNLQAARNYLNGKSGAEKPACLKLFTVKMKAMSTAGCKGLDLVEARRYINGKSDAKAPACMIK